MRTKLTVGAVVVAGMVLLLSQVAGVGASCVCGGIRREQAGQVPGRHGHEGAVDQPAQLDLCRREASPTARWRTGRSKPAARTSCCGAASPKTH